MHWKKKDNSEHIENQSPRRIESWKERKRMGLETMLQSVMKFSVFITNWDQLGNATISSRNIKEPQVIIAVRLIIMWLYGMHHMGICIVF